MALGAPKQIHDRFSWVVEIDGVQSAGFSETSGLSVEVEEVTYREGGALFPNKSPGLANITDVTLKRGTAQDLDMFVWLTTVAESVSDSGLPEPAYERNLDIVQLRRDGSERIRYRLLRCWVKKWGPGDWDNSASEKLIEEVILSVGELIVIPQSVDVPFV